MPKSSKNREVGWHADAAFGGPLCDDRIPNAWENDYGCDHWIALLHGETGYLGPHFFRALKSGSPDAGP